MEDDVKFLRKNLGDDLKIKSPRDGHPKDPDNLVQIDFHGLTVEQTGPILQRFKNSEKFLKHATCVRFITGHGRSRETEAKLYPMVSKFLYQNFKTAAGKKINKKAKGHIDLLITRSHGQKDENDSNSVSNEGKSRKSRGSGVLFSANERKSSCHSRVSVRNHHH